MMFEMNVAQKQRKSCIACRISECKVFSTESVASSCCFLHRLLLLHVSSKCLLPGCACPQKLSHPVMAQRDEVEDQTLGLRYPWFGHSTHKHVSLQLLPCKCALFLQVTAGRPAANSTWPLTARASTCTYASNCDAVAQPELYGKLGPARYGRLLPWQGRSVLGGKKTRDDIC